MSTEQVLLAIVFFPAFFTFGELYCIHSAKKALKQWCHRNGYEVVEAKLDWSEHWHEKMREYGSGRYIPLNVLLECYEGVQRGTARYYMTRPSSQNRIFVELLSWESQRNPR